MQNTPRHHGGGAKMLCHESGGPGSLGFEQGSDQHRPPLVVRQTPH